MRRMFSMVFCATVLLAGLSLTRAAPADGASSRTAFERLKSLAGKWQGAASGDSKSTVDVEYRVTAAGSAVVETEFAGMPHEMITVYHMDGDALVMTHYCATGNQPTLRFDPKRSSGSELYFDFASGSNMDPAKDVHIHSGKFRWSGDNAIASEWVAYKDGRPFETTKFSLKRVNH